MISPGRPLARPTNSCPRLLGRELRRSSICIGPTPLFVSELASDGFKGLTTMHLLNEMMNNWIDAEPETLEALTAKDCAAMELASWAWKPFFEYATTLEK